MSLRHEFWIVNKKDGRIDHFLNNASTTMSSSVKAVKKKPSFVGTGDSEMRQRFAKAGDGEEMNVKLQKKVTFYFWVHLRHEIL